MSNLLLTGGTGYAGRCFIQTVLRETDWNIISLQRDTDHSKNTIDARVTIKRWNFRGPYNLLLGDPLIDNVRYFVHLGANVHALKSLSNPGAFVQDNILGTYHALELARSIEPELFVYVSTAEVLGGRDEGYSHEGDPLRPSNPYAATKAAGELLTYSYFRSFDLPAIIVRTMNLYGEGQDDLTKFVPMVRRTVENGEKIKIHTCGGKPGVRQWLSGDSFAKQLLDLLIAARFGEIYHIVGEELTNLEMAQRIAREMGKPLNYELVRISKTHEFRYAMDKSR